MSAFFNYLKMNSLTNILNRCKAFSKIILSPKPYKKLDFSEANKDLLQRDLSETKTFSSYVFEEMLSNNAFIGIGGYDENRIIYRHRQHFTKEENPRCIHLGTDIWTDAGDPVYAPLDREIHSFTFNDQYGDYGPTIILKHKLEETIFYTLYGHLSLDSLDGLFEGKRILSGEKIASIGDYPTNGDWTPHLHFQIIADMSVYKGDFPGVCSLQDREYYLSVCPDANLILRIEENN